MKKSILTAIATIVLVGAGFGGAALAASTSGTIRPKTPTSQKSHHRKHRHHHRLIANVGVRLRQMERDGVITSAQAKSFKQELKSLNQQRKASINKSSTKAERQTERAKLRGELKSWASANNFPLAKLAPKLAKS